MFAVEFVGPTLSRKLRGKPGSSPRELETTSRPRLFDSWLCQVTTWALQLGREECVAKAQPGKILEKIPKDRLMNQWLEDRGRMLPD